MDTSASVHINVTLSQGGIIFHSFNKAHGTGHLVAFFLFPLNTQLRNGFCFLFLLHSVIILVALLHLDLSINFTLLAHPPLSFNTVLLVTLLLYKITDWR